MFPGTINKNHLVFLVFLFNLFWMPFLFLREVFMAYVENQGSQ